MCVFVCVVCLYWVVEPPSQKFNMSDPLRAHLLPQQSASQREDGEIMDYDMSSLDQPADTTTEDYEAYLALNPEDRIDYQDEMEKDAPGPSMPPPSSTDPGQPLSGGAAMSQALDDISTALSTATRPDPAGTLQALVEARRQVDAASDQGTGPRHGKRGRQVSGSAPNDSGKKAKVDHPAPNPSAVKIDMREAKPRGNRPTSFDHLWKPQTVWCAVEIGGTEMMGDPFSKTPGWDVTLTIDPGRTGQPSMGLNFRFAKDGTDSRGNDGYNTFAVGWEPGVQVGGKWMMEDLHVELAKSPSHEIMKAITYPPAVQTLCKKQKDEDRLYCMTFRSNVHKSSPMETGWATNLKGNDWIAPYHGLERMYAADQDPSYDVTVWFMAPTVHINNFSAGVLRPLVDAVQDHTPPFHQYLDEDDQPMINFNVATVKEIGNGMYVRYPKATGPNKVQTRNTLTYLNLPKTVTWDSIKTFHITFGIPVVREVQYAEAVHIRLQDEMHGVFVSKLPVFIADGKSLHPDTLMHDTFQAGIRMRRNPKTGVKDATPEVGALVTFEFDNGDPSKGRPHETKKEDMCYGRVTNLGGKAFLEKTKTDFCVLMSKPRRSRQKLYPFARPQFAPNNQLLRATIRVKINLLPAQRDLKGFKRFCDPAYGPELLDPIRLGFWSEPSRTGKKADLTQGPAHARSHANKMRYLEIIDAMKAGRKSNRSQDRVLRAASAMTSNIVAVQGPPGAGKTRTLRDKIIALTKVGHKVACVASSNVAVDTDAMAVWTGLSEEDRKTYKCLRLETDSAEKAQRLSRVGFGHYTGAAGEEDALPEYLGPKEAQDNPAIRNALDKLCVEFATRENYAVKKLEEYQTVNEAYQAVQDFEGLKQSNVPIGMTLDYRMWEITREDRRKADADYRHAQQNMSKEEFVKQTDSGHLSVTNFDRSWQYRASIKNYIDKKGAIDKKERTALEDATDALTIRVLEETHILFSTASNCGGPLLDGSRSFVPTVIFCDEAGQISIPSLCVALTTFDRWEGLFLFGDVQQLEPIMLSGQFNEFAANAKVSPLALLVHKGFPTLLLDTQYRMSPACSRFPRQVFYDDEGLKDSDEVKQDNEVRRAVRELTLGLGVRGDNGVGTEYLVNNVSHGCSRVELNGTSLVNWANANVIIRMIERFLKTGKIMAAMIKVLTYYQGQRRLLKALIAGMDWSQAIKDAIEVCTVDAFQGREAQIVIVDTVAAKDKHDPDQAPLSKASNTPDGAEDPEDEQDFGSEDYVRAGMVTSHVKNPNRLNVALTRGKDATIVVCQAALLASSLRRKRGKQFNAIANMIADATERNCRFDDNMEDSHPESVESRKKLGKNRVAAERDAQRRKDLDFIAESRAIWQRTRGFSAIPQAEPFKQYRTLKGHTTRPIGNPQLVREADAFDKEQNRVEGDKEAAEAAIVRDLGLGFTEDRMDVTGNDEDQDETRSEVSDEASRPRAERGQEVTVRVDYIDMNAGTAEGLFS